MVQIIIPQKDKMMIIIIKFIKIEEVREEIEEDLINSEMIGVISIEIEIIINLTEILIIRIDSIKKMDSIIRTDSIIKVNSITGINLIRSLINLTKIINKIDNLFFEIISIINLFY